MAAHFTPETMRFFRALSKNNDREWFERRRGVYERALKAPLLAVVTEINSELEDFAPEFIRPAHKVAMRIFRDTRFSPDKRPYKSNLSAWWAKRGLEKASGAGFYLQVGPENSFVAAGLYAPERDSLLLVRRWLAENHQRYRATLQPLFEPKGKRAAMAAIEPAALTRNPKGFPPEHPAGDLLRARNWGVTLPIAPDVVLSPSLTQEVAAQFRRAAELIALLNEPLEAARRAQRVEPMF